MTREEAINRFKGIRESFSISIAQSKFYPSKAELDELCDMAIEALHREEAEEKGYCHRIIPSNVEVVVRCKDCRWWNSETKGCKLAE